MAKIKGPFWSGHKRFPAPATYGDHEDQWRFLVSATHILSQSMGAQPRKQEGDDDYASSERNEVFAASVAQTCVIPAVHSWLCGQGHRRAMRMKQQHPIIV